MINKFHEVKVKQNEQKVRDNGTNGYGSSTILLETYIFPNSIILNNNCSAVFIHLYRCTHIFHLIKCSMLTRS